MIRPAHMDIHLSYRVGSAIGQICTSSHNLEIETGRFQGIQAEDRMCQLCQIEPETELHHICRFPEYYEIRGCFHSLFREGFWATHQSHELHRSEMLGIISTGNMQTQRESTEETKQ